MKKVITSIISLLTMTSLLVGAPQKDIVDTAVGAGSFKTLVTAVKAASLVDTLKGEGPFTVFAPTDQAFAKLPEGTVESLLKPENKDKLAEILTYHVVAGKVKAKQAAKLDSTKTVNGAEIAIKTSGKSLTINNAKVIKANIKTSNGIIHVIDTVLIPETKKDIVDTAIEAGSFNTLATAVKAADLVETLKGEGPFTVFAPTDKAFGKLPKSLLNSLLQPENKDQLAEILTYHVVAGKVKAEQAAKLDSAKTVNGAEIAIKASEKSLTINDAKVITTNIEASNGIIHVIDTVLIPETKKVANNTNHILKQAIHKGVPMFNSGHHAQTAALYMKAGNEVLGQCSSSVCSSAANTIKTAMHKAKAEHCPTSQAWIMRHAFDQVLATAN